MGSVTLMKEAVMAIHGTVVLEDQVVRFEINPNILGTLTGSYTVTDIRTGKSFRLEKAPGRDVCNMIALAVSWEGEPLTEEEVSRLEAIQSPDRDLRVIP